MHVTFWFHRLFDVVCTPISFCRHNVISQYHITVAAVKVRISKTFPDTNSLYSTHAIASVVTYHLLHVCVSPTHEIFPQTIIFVFVLAIPSP